MTGQQYKEYKLNQCHSLYEEPVASRWHRYGDILVPLITLPLLIIIAVTLHNSITDNWNNEEFSRFKVLILCIALLVTSFTVFCYVCLRLRLILGGKRSRLRLPIIRSRTNNNLLRSVNSDLHLIVPFNSAQKSYDTIVLKFPPPYYSVYNLNEVGTDSFNKKYFKIFRW